MSTPPHMPTYVALAHAFAAEGVDHHFALMGDGNMHWVTAMKDIDGMNTYHARHEHCACAMAMGYTSATGKVGVASVTCGPGFTQIMTALTSAARSQVPMVVFAGETPVGAKWYGQMLDQQPLAAACGAHYISAHSPQRMYQYVREAFHIARHERKPVVLGIPVRSAAAAAAEHRRVQAGRADHAGGRADSAEPRSGRRGRRQADQGEMPDHHRRPRRRLGRRPQGASRNWRKRAARCCRRRCSAAACTTTIRSRSASPAALPAPLRAKCSGRPISSSRSARA